MHDDIIKWKYFLHYWPFVGGIHRAPVNSPHKGQWRRALMFPLICAWINGWINNGEAGDLICHHVHYDITVMGVRIMHQQPRNAQFADFITSVEPWWHHQIETFSTLPFLFWGESTCRRWISLKKANDAELWCLAFDVHLNSLPCSTTYQWLSIPDSKVHGAIMGPIWGRQDPGGPHVRPMNFAIWDDAISCLGALGFPRECHLWCTMKENP